MVKKQEPKKHHYISQLLLKRFCQEGESLYYWDNKSKRLMVKNISNIFMKESMYRSKEINPDNPVEVENNLGVFEHDITPLIDRLVSGDTVSLTTSELEELMLFLSLLSFRSDLRKEQYRNVSFDPETMKKINEFKGEDGFELFWKKEINALAKCRKYADIYSSKDIDSVIKHEFELDFKNYYLSIVDTAELCFLISDVYPTLEMFPIDAGYGDYMHAIYPISSTRALVMSHACFSDPFAFFNPVLRRCMFASRLKGNAFSTSQIETVRHNETNPEDTFIYKVSAISEEETTYINCLILNETRKGIGFSDPSKIISSLIAYQNEKNLKNDFRDLQIAINSIHTK